MTAVPTEVERARRTAYVRESKAAFAQGVTLQRARDREAKADEWTHWFRQKMDVGDCTDAAELLPDAFAKLDQLIDDRVAVAINEFKTAVRGALK